MNRYTIILKTMLVVPVALAGMGIAVAADDPTLSAAYQEQTARALMVDMDNTDADGDQMVSKREFQSHLDRVSAQVFARMDTNDDGMLSHDEMMAAMPAEGGEQ